MLKKFGEFFDRSKMENSLKQIFLTGFEWDLQVSESEIFVPLRQSLFEKKKVYIGTSCQYWIFPNKGRGFMNSYECYVANNCVINTFCRIIVTFKSNIPGSAVR